jgi:hypothetical protein
VASAPLDHQGVDPVLEVAVEDERHAMPMPKAVL